MVRHFRLINGEEILGELIEETASEVFVKNPHVVVETSSAIVLSKYVPFSHQQVISLRRDHIITTTELHDEMIRYFKNSIILSKNTADAAIEGLMKVNDMMEEMIYNLPLGRDVDPLEEFMDLQSTHPTSNTVH
jgi:hypothetical protein